MALAAAVSASIAVYTASLAAAALAAVALLPLAATLPGLIAGRRRIESWAALCTVVYAAAATGEIVASGGTAPFAAFALLAALCELGLLFVLSRRPQASRE